MLGEIPRWRCAQRGWMLALRVFQSCLSVLTVSFLFRERLRPSCPPIFFLQGICEKKTAARGFEWPVTSELTSAQCPVPRHHRREREHSPILFTQHNQRPSAVSDMISFGASDSEINDSLFFCRLRTRRCYQALWLAPPSYRRPLHVMPDSERMELIRIMTKAVNELGIEWSTLRSHLAAGWTSVFSRGAIKSLPTLVPLLPRSSWRAHDIRACPPLISHPSFCFSCSHMKALKKKDTSTCLLWMSLWPHISARPQLSDGRRGRAIRPEPHLHSLEAPTWRLNKRLQHYTRWLCSRSSRPRCSPMRKPVWIQPLSGIWRARQTWLYAPPKPPPKPLDVRCPAW